MRTSASAASRSLRALRACTMGVLAGGLVVACSTSSPSGQGDGGACNSGLYTSCSEGTLPCTMGSVITDGSGDSLLDFCPPPDPGPGKIYVTASGETLSLVGFNFPPAPSPDNTFMVDGWNFSITAYITIFSAITLWQDPDLSSSNQSLHGGQVSQLNGPFVVDLHKGTSAGPIIVGQGGAGEEATPIGVLAPPYQDTPYAFGFSTIPPTSIPAASGGGMDPYNAYNVNLDATENAYYAYMVENGYTVLYVGTATWTGNQPWTNLANGPQPSPAPSTEQEPPGSYCTETAVMPQYDFEEPPFPTTMDFWLGFSTPTNYVNCQNGSEFPGLPGINPDEDHPRGIQVSQTQSEPAQVTIHMDHPFWESFAENSPLHWDNIAAQFVGQTTMTCDPTMKDGGPTCVHTEDLKTLGGVPGKAPLDFTAFTDASDKPLPFRNCVGPENYTPLGSGQMHYDPLTVPVCIGKNTPGSCLGSYYDFIRYSQSTQGHLNSQGFCFIDRQYPSPGSSASGG
jgi:hypothetical protein